LLILINSKESSFVFNGNNINKDFEGSLYDFKSKNNIYTALKMRIMI
jgi:hypothetical protein